MSVMSVSYCMLLDCSPAAHSPHRVIFCCLNGASFVIAVRVSGCNSDALVLIELTVPLSLATAEAFTCDFKL